MKRVAAIAIINDHHMLMGRRKESRAFTNPGGHLNEGEDPKAGAVREVKEETGLDLDPHYFKHLETRVVKKPDGEKIEVHGFRVDLRSKPATTKTDDPDDEVERWQWIKLDTDLDHIKDNLHVPLGDNVLLDNILKGDKPVKRHAQKFWNTAKKVGVEGYEEVKDKAFKEGPQYFNLKDKKQEKKAAEVVSGGKADYMSDDRFSDKQLRMGVTIEKEHTTNPRLAKEIAKDHLTEDKNYYTHLKEMEDKYVEKKAFWNGFLKKASGPQLPNNKNDWIGIKNKLEKKSSALDTLWELEERNAPAEEQRRFIMKNEKSLIKDMSEGYKNYLKRPEEKITPPTLKEKIMRVPGPAAGFGLYGAVPGFILGSRKASMIGGALGSTVGGYLGYTDLGRTNEAILRSNRDKLKFKNMSELEKKKYVTDHAKKEILERLSWIPEDKKD